MTKYKNFTFKQLEKMFTAQYPTGGIEKVSSTKYGVFYTETGKWYEYTCYNLYDLAKCLNLATEEQILKMQGK